MDLPFVYPLDLNGYVYAEIEGVVEVETDGPINLRPQDGQYREPDWYVRDIALYPLEGSSRFYIPRDHQLYTQIHMWFLKTQGHRVVERLREAA